MLLCVQHRNTYSTSHISYSTISLHPNQSHHVFAELPDDPSIEAETGCSQAEQEQHTVNVVISNNDASLRQPQHHVITDDTTFTNMNRVIRVKQLYRVKQPHYEYAQVSYTILSLVLYSSVCQFIVLPDSESY